jgi:hypothetical protein
LAEASTEDRIGMIDATQVAAMAAVGAFKGDSEVEFVSQSAGIPKIHGL